MTNRQFSVGRWRISEVSGRDMALVNTNRQIAPALAVTSLTEWARSTNSRAIGGVPQSENGDAG